MDDEPEDSFGASIDPPPLRHIARPQPQRYPKVKPEESTQRAAQIAVDMCLMNCQYFITLSQFMPLGEVFHVQMQLLYGLIDTMGATANIDTNVVLDMAKKYFEHMRRERNGVDGRRIRGKYEKDK
jgi:hypothetical protein